MKENAKISFQKNQFRRMKNKIKLRSGTVFQIKVRANQF